MAKLNLAVYEVILSLPEDWKDKEADKAIDILEEEDLDKKIVKYVEEFIKVHPELAGVKVRIR